MPNLKSYDPSKVNFIYAGLSIEEFMDGSFITVTRDSPTYRDLIGCDGETTRLKTKDTRGNIVFNLLQTSRSNLKLSAFMLGDETIGQGGLPVLVRDKNGTNLMACAEAWISKPPEIIYSKGVEGRRWSLRCNGLYVLIGGQPNA